MGKPIVESTTLETRFSGEVKLTNARYVKNRDNKPVILSRSGELSVIDACNRACSFCPKSDESIAPNSYQKMTIKFVHLILRAAFGV